MDTKLIRSVDDEELLGVLRGVKNMSLARARLSEYLSGRPALPPLLGVTEAAEILGVRKPHLYRLRDQGRLPEPVMTLMAGQIFLEEDIRKLAAELAAERSAREVKRVTASEKAAEKAAAA